VPTVSLPLPPLNSPPWKVTTVSLPLPPLNTPPRETTERRVVAVHEGWGQPANRLGKRSVERK
jgi:hypothetical protein